MAGGLLLDVEGVLVADKRYAAVDSAVEFVQWARAAGLPFRLITNNTTDDRPSILEKLRRAGFDFSPHELHTCIDAALRRLRELAARRCLVLGNEALRRMFRETGLEVVDESSVDAVVVGLDTGLTYERLATACEALTRHGASFLALHRNRLLPDARGRAAPSVGAIAAAIEYATQREPIVIGKPSREYFQQALDELGVEAAQVVVVSDDPFSDLAGAKRMGMRGVFVLSGKYHDARVVEAIPEAERPDAVIARIGDLVEGGRLRL